MTWTSFECRKLQKLKYDDQNQSLDIIYRDGDHARADGITLRRYEELISAAVEDRDIYFTNLIEPHVTWRRAATRPPKIPPAFIALMLVVICSSWLLFWFADHLLFVMKR